MNMKIADMNEHKHERNCSHRGLECIRDVIM